MSQTANNLLRVSITGIDGAGKDTGTKLALQKVAAAGIAPIVKVVRPMYIINADGVETQIYKSWKEFTDTVHEFADKTRQKCAILGANALDVMVQSRFIEPAALRANPDAKVLASSRDMRVDPAVYSEFYCTMFAKRMSMKKRLQAAQFMTGISRDLIVRLVVDPKTAVKRIDERIAREAAEKEQSGVAGMRDKWRHMHENPDDLQKLDAAYAMALKVLSEYSSTEILEIDTNDMTREEVAEQVADKITKSYNLKKRREMSKIQTIPSDDFAHELTDMIEKSRRQIIISVMIAKYDEKSALVFGALHRALSRDVSVKIYVDRYSFSPRSESTRRLNRAKTQNVLRELQAAGAKIVRLGHVSLNPFRGRFHQKIYLIDDFAMIGGMNLSFATPSIDFVVKFCDQKLVNFLTDFLTKIERGQTKNLSYEINKDNKILCDAGSKTSLIYDTAKDLAENAEKVIVTSRMCPSGNLIKILKKRDTIYVFNKFYRAALPTAMAIIFDQIRYGVKNSYSGRNYWHAKIMLTEASDGKKAVIIGSHNFNLLGVKYRTREIALVSSDASLYAELYAKITNFVDV